MVKVINNFLFLFPVLGLIAGLSLGVTIPVFSLMIIFSIRKNLTINLKNLKLEILFFSYLLLSILWSINFKKSIFSLLLIISIYILFVILVQNIKIIKTQINISEKTLLYSLLTALLLFYIEFATDGSISIFFRQLIQTKSNYHFYLYYLDRGCAFIALFAWLVIAALIYSKKYNLSMITYFATLITLSFSDSFAGFLSFFISGIIFILTLFSPFKNSKILSVILIFCTLIFVVLTFKIDPFKTANEANFLPISAKHRLFIWSYCADKISEKPMLGWGHGASRLFNINDDEIINYQGHNLHPLPTHPHNNIIQILLENGFIGLFLYMAFICKYLILWDKLFKQNSDAPIKPMIYSSKYIKSAGYACFSAFFLISMISFNMWQVWWLCSYLWCGFMLKYFTQINNN